MKVTQVYKGRSEKVVEVEASFDSVRSEVTDVALAAAGETRDSLFGTYCNWDWDRNIWVVRMHTS
jgi:hypothetical protein